MIGVFQYLRGCHKEEGNERRNLQTLRTINQWQSLPSEVVGAPSLEAFKKHFWIATWGWIRRPPRSLPTSVILLTKPESNFPCGLLKPQTPFPVCPVVNTKLQVPWDKSSSYSVSFSIGACRQKERDLLDRHKNCWIVDRRAVQRADGGKLAKITDEILLCSRQEGFPTRGRAVSGAKLVVTSGTHPTPQVGDLLRGKCELFKADRDCFSRNSHPNLGSWRCAERDTFSLSQGLSIAAVLSCVDFNSQNSPASLEREGGGRERGRSRRKKEGRKEGRKERGSKEGRIEKERMNERKKERKRKKEKGRKEDKGRKEQKKERREGGREEGRKERRRKIEFLNF
ncbi:Splicing regulatory glutamine/lysine-rich protein 1, partial [Ophiophagus hannah]